MLSHTSTEWAPWYVIPADRKWFGRSRAGAVIAHTLMEIDPHFPGGRRGAARGAVEVKAMLEAQAPKGAAAGPVRRAPRRAAAAGHHERRIGDARGAEQRSNRRRIATMATTGDRTWTTAVDETGGTRRPGAGRRAARGRSGDRADRPTSGRAARRDGPNALPAEQPPPGWRRFLAQYGSYMQMILVGAAIVSLVIKEWSTARPADR